MDGSGRPPYTSSPKFKQFDLSSEDDQTELLTAIAKSISIVTPGICVKVYIYDTHQLFLFYAFSIHILVNYF